MRKKTFLKDASRLIVVIVRALLFICLTAGAQNTGKQLLQNSRPQGISNLSPIGRLAGETRMDLAVGLPLRNEKALDDLLQQLYDPASPNYRHYLKPAQFIERFGPAESDYQAVENFFRANGFAITAEHPDHILLNISGTASDIERVFHVTMQTYHHPAENRVFFAPDTVPSLDLIVPLAHISGLDNYSLPHPRLTKKILLGELHTIAHQTGSGPGGGYMGSDFRAAYIPGVSLTGTGQTLGLLEFDSYYSNDITAYESNANLSAIAITNVSVQGGVSSPGDGNDEVALDIDMAMSMAPGLSKIVVYETQQSTSWDTLLDYMANDTVNSPQEFSCSWGEDSPGSPDTTAEGYFKQMQIQGQSFFDAVGDSDAFNDGIPFPSESTNIMQVGATTLTTTGPNGARILETTWNWGGNAEGDPTGSIGSSGGVSKNFVIPTWQKGISMTANEGSNNMRNVPDMAFTGDNVFVVADNGTNYMVGGTSCAAPLWAAFTALVNQQALAKASSTVGFINPAIYAIGKSSSYLSDFNDITTGNNYWYSSTTKFPAVAGYDLCTGWGTPAGDNMIDALAVVSDALAVTPGHGFVAFGAASGTFTASTLTFSLTNSGTGSLNWSLINTSSWLNVSATAGTLLPAGPATNVTVSLNTNAYNLPPGTYTASMLFSNNTSHATRMREFTLLAGEELVQNGGFEVSPFSLSYWAQSGSALSFYWDFVDGLPSEQSSDSGITPYSGDYLAVFGTDGSIGYISQNLPTVPGQNYLLSFWLTDTGSRATEQFFANWDTNAATTNTIFSLSNPAAFGWIYTNFILTATSTNTLLQFGARNDEYWFGLDDVSVTPIPAPNIRSFNSIPPNALSLTWNSQTGVVYQVQSSTNLLSTNWSNLTSNTATGPTLTVTNPIGQYPYLFYRIQMQ